VAVSGIGASGTLALWEPKSAVNNTAVAPLTIPPPAQAVAPVAPTADTSQVTLTSSAPASTLTYAKPLQPKPDQVVWAAPPSDSISSLMKTNLRYADDSSSLLRGIGSALLGRFATTQADFQQAAADVTPGIQTTAVDALQSAQSAANTVSLKIHLVSGREVDVSVSYGGGDGIQNSLSIAVHTSGKLTAAEQAAIASLSAGFEAALQGVSRVAARIDVAGLASFDPATVSSVDLKVRGPSAPPNSVASADYNPLQSLDFHADATTRSLAVKTLAGNVSVSVDLSRSAFLGTQAQQQAAIQKFLSQFDAANTRGHGGSILLGEFEDTFKQLNSSPAAGQGPQALGSLPLSAQDLSVLSGLNDFSASMSGDFRNDVAKESGHIDYQVSQSTQLRGVNQDSLSVVQTQTASLSAEYAKYRDGVSLAKGDYDIYRINDSKSTTTAFEYADNKLKSAFITTIVKQMDEYEKLIGFKVVQKKDTPTNHSTVQDISAQWSARDVP